MDTNEIKSLLDKQGEAFESFKETHAELKKNDTLTAEKLSRIEASLDSAVEAKAAIEAAIAAEKKEREALEMKLNRMGISKDGEAGKRELEIKSLNQVLESHAAEKKERFEPLDEKAFDEYKAAHSRYLRKGDRLLSADEVKTLSVGSDPDGGYFVTPDTGGRIVRKVYETSPIRQIASVQTISSDALEGIEDTGEAGAGYAGENAQGSDTTTPQVGKWRIPVYWIDTEPKTTQQLLDDSAVDIESWLAGKVGDKMGRFENAEFVTGATKIRGFASYTTAADSGSGVTWGTIGHVMSGASADFASSNPADKIFDLIGNVKEAYLMNARFVTRRSVITKIRKFKESTTNGYIWQPGLQAGMPETLLGYPITRAEDVATLAADSLSLWFGDFAAAYQIVDRQGIRVLRDNLTSKPYVKFYTTKRTGGGVVNFDAIKVMKFNA
ncbi:MAG: phage major capsid protein [Beijerinckiaceae bacterium]|nr:phage major capsid protein [Beijerinckiaceae bacterium]